MLTAEELAICVAKTRVGHCNRHTFCSRLVAAGVSLETVPVLAAMATTLHPTPCRGTLDGEYLNFQTATKTPPTEKTSKLTGFKSYKAFVLWCQEEDLNPFRYVHSTTYRAWTVE